MNSLLNFVLGMYLTTCLNRWWSIRTTGEDAFMNSANNISILLGMVHRTEDIKQDRAQVCIEECTSQERLFSLKIS